MTLFSLRGVRQIFGDRTVLDIETMELEAGRSYALLGPNGSGKTTLLQLLALLRPPSRGDLYLGDQRVNWRGSALQSSRRRVVLVDQHPIMFTATVRENVEYGLKMRGVKGHKRRQIANRYLERVGMAEFADRRAHLLSGGETQRVAMARALACQPEVLLLDEPTAGVDLANQAVIERLIQKIHRELGLTVIFSSHNRLQAFKLSQEQIFLCQGKLAGIVGENQFAGQVCRQSGKTFCRIAEGVEVELAGGAEGVSGAVTVAINPAAIGIYPLDRQNQAGEADRPPGTLLPARVRQMTAEGDQIRTLLELGGITITALLSREEIQGGGVVVGDRVLVELKPQAVQVISSPADQIPPH
ncbi:ABC transporter ATP-binding protein [Desulfurivibrio sp. D14AmB]|uniref:ABC transporter ATP-binding protein n=1 Tax=Desulfurivibrio sp. D14AmB TaxID=3374370 RepID=UPI00376EE2F2